MSNRYWRRQLRLLRLVLGDAGRFERVPAAAKDRDDAAADGHWPPHLLPEEHDAEEDVDELGQVVHDDERRRADQALQPEPRRRDQEPGNTRESDVQRTRRIHGAHRRDGAVDGFALRQAHGGDQRHAQSVVEQGHVELGEAFHRRVAGEVRLERDAVGHLRAHVEEDPAEADPREVDGTVPVHGRADHDRELRGEHPGRSARLAHHDLGGRREDRGGVPEDQDGRDAGVLEALQRRKDHCGEDDRDRDPCYHDAGRHASHGAPAVREHTEQHQRPNDLHQQQGARQGQGSDRLLVADDHGDRGEGKLQQRADELRE
mmetsp:Transcript_32396/g.100204  ORF Transcript_32396/g.100204 Transcript_32396/m.100204 type:complete len:317 (-) Transcript_32396:41-991(-)